MINLVKIYNFNSNDSDVAYINVERISSIKEENYGNTYMIYMDNNCLYETDKDSFKKIMEAINR